MEIQKLEGLKNLPSKQRAIKLKSNFFKKNECYIMDEKTYVLADFQQLPDFL